MTSLNLTPREAELLCGVIAVMKADITWTEVAIKANFTNAKQARDKWPSVRDKIIACGTKKAEKSDAAGEDAHAADGDALPTTTTTKKAVAKKRKAAGDSTAVKAKKPKKNSAAAAAVKVKPEAEDEDEDVFD